VLEAVTAATDSGFAGNASPLQVIGAGPAGIGMVLALCNRIVADGSNGGVAQKILDSLQILEASQRPGGKMEHYQVNANTSAPDVVQGILEGNPFVDIRERYLQQPDTRLRLIPLSRIGELMVQPLVQDLIKFLGARLRCRTRVARIEIGDQGFTSFDQEDRPLARSKSLLLCCGGNDQALSALRDYADRWQGSEQFLMRKSLQDLPADDGAIVIVGASHSAFSCAWRLLYDPLFDAWAKGREIVILQRRERIKLRCSKDFAYQHHIEYNPETDVCPATGVVFFNGGLRKDAKMLYLDIRDGRETRVRIEKIDRIEDQQELLQRAALILQATGFVANLPRVERAGKVLRFGEPTATGELCELGSKRVVRGLFGMGLGMNVLPPGRDHGEASFSGGIHGFQSYPLAIAPHIIDHLVEQNLLEADT
jgi:hypothetical protein